MVSFATFLTLVLAVAASVAGDMGRRELKMESGMQRRDGVVGVDCSDSDKAAFLSAS
jgi:hypothetical protein